MTMKKMAEKKVPNKRWKREDTLGLIVSIIISVLVSLLTTLYFLK